MTVSTSTPTDLSVEEAASRVIEEYDGLLAASDEAQEYNLRVAEQNERVTHALQALREASDA